MHVVHSQLSLSLFLSVILCWLLCQGVGWCVARLLAALVGWLVESRSVGWLSVECMVGLVGCLPSRLVASLVGAFVGG